MFSPLGRGAMVFLAVVGLIAVRAAWQAARSRGQGAPSASVVDYLSARAGAAGFARATGPAAITFPADAGPHPAYQTEWWYYTGNLAVIEGGSMPDGVESTASSRPGHDDGGRRLGFQLTFFRRALAPPAEVSARASAWATEQIYLAHFTVTDVAAGTFHSSERLARGAAGLAGAQADPFQVWVETWSAAAQVDGRPVAEGGPAVVDPGKMGVDGPMGPTTRLRAADGQVAIDLALRQAKPPALHGERGFSPKGPERGDASYYYSYPRLKASGVITTAAGAFPVAGAAWMDHEWSTGALAAGLTGWDWFSLQLDDGRELMLFHLREQGGGVAAESAGSLIGPDGTVSPLRRGDFAIEPRGTWTSPRTAGVYPSGWRVVVPGAGLDLGVEPLVRDQELDVGFKYWEGAVRVTATSNGRPVAGYGYVELTGYAPSASGGVVPGGS